MHYEVYEIICADSLIRPCFYIPQVEKSQYIMASFIVQIVGFMQQILEMSHNVSK